MMKRCQKCNYDNYSEARFCSNCGNTFENNISIENENVKKNIFKITLFFFSILALILVNEFGNLEGYKNNFILDFVFAFIVIIFFFVDFRINVRNILPQKVVIFQIFLVIFLAIIFGLMIYYLGGFLNKELLKKCDPNYFLIFLDSSNPILYAYISVALFPAIFEELAFRNVFFNLLLKATSVKATIIVTSILFAFLHLGFISFLLHFPIGLFLGWLRMKNNSILYGIVFHFFYNATILSIDVFHYFHIF